MDKKKSVRNVFILNPTLNISLNNMFSKICWFFTKNYTIYPNYKYSSSLLLYTQTHNHIATKSPSPGINSRRKAPKGSCHLLQTYRQTDKLSKQPGTPPPNLRQRDDAGSARVFRSSKSLRNYDPRAAT